MGLITVDNRTISDVLAGYDVTASQTHMMTATCHADRKGNRLVIGSIHDIDDSDWQAVMDRFPVSPDYEYDYAFHDGIHWHTIFDDPASRPPVR
jgi:hypothetical protein